MKHVNVESLLIRFLKRKTTIPCAVDVPKPRPVRWVRVSRVGGAQELARDLPLVLVEVWAESTQEAGDTALEIQSLCMLLALEEPRVSRVASQGLVNLPDPKSNSPRYQFLLALVTTPER